MAGTWQPLASQPKFKASTMLLLLDGSVTVHEQGGINWWRLNPDQFGNYVNGTWVKLAPMKYTRLYYASAVLKDGRVFVAGGEYSNAGSETSTAEIYNPVLDKWDLVKPVGWGHIGDAPCCVLPDGRVLLGSIDDTKTAIYDPQTANWILSAGKDDPSSEETWTLLPDNTVLTAECTNHPRAEKYLISQDKWVSAGASPVELVEGSSLEIGPAFLLPDGRVFAIGATGHTALYTPPSTVDQPGSWVAGPDFPKTNIGQTLGAKDAPGCLLPNGNVLCVAGPVDGISGDYLTPTYFFEFDGGNISPVAAPANSNNVPYAGRMLLLPTGQVLFVAGTPEIYMYTPSGGPNSAWRPKITASPSLVRPLSSYTLYGTQLNGLSQAVGYGDDASAATNYPLVRLRNLLSKKVWYCTTFDHSSMGVATGGSIQSTNFSVPVDVEMGPTELCVIANGISDCITVQVGPQALHIPLNLGSINILIGSLADGPLWVLGPNGPVPVGPWGPDLVKQAKLARANLIASVRSLQSLGRKVVSERAKASGQVSPSVDPDMAKFTKVVPRRKPQKPSRQSKLKPARSKK